MAIEHRLLPEQVQRDLKRVATAAQIVRKTEPFDAVRYEALIRLLDQITTKAKRRYPQYYWTGQEAYARRKEHEKARCTKAAESKASANDSMFGFDDAA
jgi:hypothetical protein